MTLTVIIVFAAALFVALVARRMWFFFHKNPTLRVLMYHKFSTLEKDFLTVSADDFAAQLAYAQSVGFQFITAKDVLDFYVFSKALPKRSLLVTFDDAYVLQMEIAAPILKKYGVRATVFVPTNYVGTASNWDETNAAPILSLAELRKIDPSVFDLALHSAAHFNYKNASIEDIKNDVDACLDFFQKNTLAFAPMFAYPYGGRPKNAEILRGMKTHFAARHIQVAFRIGNRVNALKTNDLYELQRIDVRGDESFSTFKKKLKYGRF